MKRLMREDAIQMKQLYGHTARVFALHCRGNYLATGEISFQCNKFLRTHVVTVTHLS